MQLSLKNACWIFVVALSLAGCRSLTVSSNPSPSDVLAPPSSPAATETLPTATPQPPPANAAATADAVVQEIIENPVWLRPNQTQQEQPANEGDSMVAGDTIRTADQALAEVDLASGLAFRIGGNAALTLQPNNQLKFDSGEMITWVNPDRQVSTQIVTPVGIAGLRGTTLFVKIPETNTGEVEFFAWEGTIAIRPNGAAEELIIRSGEQLFIRPGDRDIAQLRRRIRRLPRREILQRRRQSRLLNDFARPLPTLRQIEATLEEQP